MTTVIPAPDSNNEWRLSTPGSSGWERSPRPDAMNKYFMVSTDGHAQEPKDLWATRMDEKYQDRLPGVIIGMKGQKFQKTEGFRNPLKLNSIQFEGQDLLRNKAGYTPEDRLADLAADGTDAEVIFPNKGLTMWATSDPLFSHAMCRVYNDWAWEVFGPYGDQLLPMACIAPAALDEAIAEIQRCADLGFKGLQLPSKPIWGAPDHEALNYNLREFDPLWAAICEVDLPVTFHISTGRDPRTARSRGGAVINYAVHSLAQNIEPIANLCASGVAEQFPNLRFGSVEAGIGFAVPLKTKEDDFVGKDGFSFTVSKKLVISARNVLKVYKGTNIEVTALDKVKINPIELDAQEGLSLINGTQVSTAIGIKALFEAQNLLYSADIVSALSVEASLSTREVFNPVIHRLKKHKGQKNS